MKSSKIAACYGQLRLSAVSAWAGKNSDRTKWHRTKKNPSIVAPPISQGLPPLTSRVGCVALFLSLSLTRALRWRHRAVFFSSGKIEFKVSE